MRPQFLADVRRFLGDPDDQVERWNWDGAPSGIEAKPESRNIFPVYADQDAAADPLTLASESYEGSKGQAEGDADALSELEFLAQHKWLQRYSSKTQAKRVIKGRIIVSTLLVITKEKDKEGWSQGDPETEEAADP